MSKRRREGRGLTDRTPYGFTYAEAIHALRRCRGFDQTIRGDFTYQDPVEKCAVCERPSEGWYNIRWKRSGRTDKPLCGKHRDKIAALREEYWTQKAKEWEEERERARLAAERRRAEARAGLIHNYNPENRKAYVYKLYDSDRELLYVGKTYRVNERLRGDRGHAHTKVWYPEVRFCEVEVHLSDAHAFEAEAHHIWNLTPVYNRTRPSRALDNPPTPLLRYLGRV